MDVAVVLGDPMPAKPMKLTKLESLDAPAFLALLDGDRTCGWTC